MSTGSNKLITTFVLVILIVLALMAMGAFSSYYDNLPQHIGPLGSITDGQAVIAYLLP